VAPLIRLVEVLLKTETFLRDRGIDTPRLDAELILADVLNIKRLQIYLEHDRPMAEDELARVRPLVARRGKREPLAWIIGSAGFHAIDLAIQPGVLVPRPDTETLVEAALEWIDADADPIYVADVGCGSGAVGLSIATARPASRIYATDVSPEAIATTKANVAALGLTDRVAVLTGDLLSPIPPQRPVHWVLSNPPYIPSGDIDALMPEVSRHEPRLALDGGRDGLDFYRRLVPLAGNRASHGLLVEVGIEQAGRVVDLFRRGGFVGVETWTDLGGIKRVVGGRKPRSDDYEAEAQPH